MEYLNLKNTILTVLLAKFILRNFNNKKEEEEDHHEIKVKHHKKEKKVTYYLAKSFVYVWQGIAGYYDEDDKPIDEENPIIICGTTQPSATKGDGVIYVGNISLDSPSGKYYFLNVPDALYSSAYGPRYNSKTKDFTIVGSYNNRNDKNTYGFFFRGKLDELNDPRKYILNMNNTKEKIYETTFAHSTFGNFVVGNSGSFSNNSKKQEVAWIYNIEEKTYYNYSYPDENVVTTTLYGIVKNNDLTYTLTGGYSTSTNTEIEFEYGFIVDMIYNPITKAMEFRYATSLQYPLGYLTHFEGISKTIDPDIYKLAGDSISIANIRLGFAATLFRRREIGKYVILDKTEISYDKKGVTTSNSVLENNIVGLYINKEPKTFQCVIDKDSKLFPCECSDESY